MNKFGVKISTGNRGLTLLEIAISLAILSIALVALVNFFPIGLRASRRASNFSEAGILAQRVIDNIKRAAAIYDDGDIGIVSPYTNDNCTGYFELTVDGGPVAPYYFPFSDDDLSETTWIDAEGVYKYQYNYTDMKVYIKVENWDANNSGGVDTDDVLLSQRVYVAIYWTEGEVERADTFITYISNPFYEKYK
jgi:prepilin-type N-terminal cleavage/methylation domain-containing protein